MSAFLVFAMDGREYAAAIEQVREVVRSGPVTAPLGQTGPVAGVLSLRGAALAVVDLRAATTAGDIVVVALPDGTTRGLAVDTVRAVVAVDALPPAGGAGPGLPSYVTGLRSGAYGLVFEVDLARLLLAG